jgi:hypothetical protein
MKSPATLDNAERILEAHHTADLGHPTSKALRTPPGLSIHLGHFLSDEVTMPLSPVPGHRQQYGSRRLVKTEEKGSGREPCHAPIARRAYG